MSKTSRLLDVTSRGKRVISYMMNRGWRHDMTMTWGKKDGSPNIIGRGWGKDVDIIHRKCQPISDMIGRGGLWSTNVSDSNWASDRLRHLIPRSRERLVLKNCKRERILVYPLSQPRKVVANAKMV
jgi:hypothetical protein